MQSACNPGLHRYNALKNHFFHPFNHANGLGRHFWNHLVCCCEPRRSITSLMLFGLRRGSAAVISARSSLRKPGSFEYSLVAFWRRSIREEQTIKRNAKSINIGRYRYDSMLSLLRRHESRGTKRGREPLPPSFVRRESWNNHRIEKSLYINKEEIQHNGTIVGTDYYVGWLEISMQNSVNLESHLVHVDGFMRSKHCGR